MKFERVMALLMWVLAACLLWFVYCVGMPPAPIAPLVGLVVLMMFGSGVFFWLMK